MKSLDSETLGPEVYHMNPRKSDTDMYRTVMKLLPTAFATYGSYLFKVFTARKIICMKLNYEGKSRF